MTFGTTFGTTFLGDPPTDRGPIVGIPYEDLLELRKNLEATQQALLISQNSNEKLKEDLKLERVKVDWLKRALEVQRKTAQDYCWVRYSNREPANLRSPAVFTSHEWQKIGEAMDAALEIMGENE
jgi:hypothetical protein